MKRSLRPHESLCTVRTGESMTPWDCPSAGRGTSQASCSGAPRCSSDPRNRIQWTESSDLTGMNPTPSCCVTYLLNKNLLRIDLINTLRATWGHGSDHPCTRFRGSAVRTQGSRAALRLDPVRDGSGLRSASRRQDGAAVALCFRQTHRSIYRERQVTYAADRRLSACGLRMARCSPPRRVRACHVGGGSP